MAARVARKQELLRAQARGGGGGGGNGGMDGYIASDINPEAGVNLRARSAIDNAKIALAKQEELKKQLSVGCERTVTFPDGKVISELVEPLLEQAKDLPLEGFVREKAIKRRLDLLTREAQFAERTQRFSRGSSCGCLQACMRRRVWWPRRR